MKFFSFFFKKSVNETLKVICNAYYYKLNATNDSKQAFIAMANEAFNQVQKNHRSNFTSPSDTYIMLGKKFNDLSSSHLTNREYLADYLFNMMMYIRHDWYRPDNDIGKYVRLKAMINMNLR